MQIQKQFYVVCVILFYCYTIDGSTVCLISTILTSQVVATAQTDSLTHKYGLLPDLRKTIDGITLALLILTHHYLFIMQLFYI